VRGRVLSIKSVDCQVEETWFFGIICGNMTGVCALDWNGRGVEFDRV